MIVHLSDDDDRNQMKNVVLIDDHRVNSEIHA
jgi:hypothetical protein